MKTLLSLTFVGLISVTTSVKTFAGDREWATVGKVLTGVAAVHVIDRIVNPPQPVVVYHQPVIVQHPTTVIVPQPVVIQPAPVVYVSSPVYYQTAPVVVYGPICPPHYHYRTYRPIHHFH